MRYRALLYAACAVLLIALHAPYLRLPFHWDELGQFVPAALDLYRDGAWITHSAEPNIHPPGIMVLLAVVWTLVGYSILHTRLAMLFVAAAGVYFSFLLAIRLGRAAPGAPAFAAAGFIVAAPMFYTQSMMVLLDMPAMVLTVAALLLFFDRRYVWCAIVCTALVLTKETALTTPAVFGAWLLVNDRKKSCLWFLLPAAALAAWLMVLHNVTGSWFGSASFAQYNITQSLTPVHVLYALSRRCYTLFIADGHWIGAIMLFLAARRGWPGFRTREWGIAATVGIVQVLAVTILGGAVLDRYLLPALPILYAAFAVATSGLLPKWRFAANGGLLALLVAGWFWNSPFPVPLENNLAVVDFVRLQREAAEYLEANYAQRRVVTTWPLAAAVVQPDLGYVSNPLQAINTVHWELADIAAVHPGPNDVIVMYSHGQTPRGLLLRVPILRSFAERMAPPVEASSAELATLGFISVARWTNGEQWIEIYAPAPL